jgi:hypothetical protein
MRLPQKKKPGDPVLAADWNLLLDAIAARTPRPGTGLELIASSGGFAYSRPGVGPTQNPHLPPFGVIGIEKDSTTYLVTLKEGWVIERKPKTGDEPTVVFHMPKAGATALDAIPRPQIAMTIGQTLWCKFTTGTTGEINAPPEIIATTDDQNGNHHYPQDPEGSGSDGTYYVKLIKLEQEDGTPKVKVYQQSDIEHWSTLWTGENNGDGARVFKEHDEDTNIYHFRTIKHRETQNQIEVIEDGDIIRVQGNNKDGTLVLVGSMMSNTTLLEWKDGLVISEGEKSLTVRELMVCENGTPTAVKFLTVP